MSQTRKTLTEIRTWLEADDARSRPYRAKRLARLLEDFDAERIFQLHGGDMAFVALEEARRAFVCGLFGTCTILAQVCLEHTLGGLFRMTGRNDLERTTFENLLEQALREGYLSQEELEVFDRLRIIRNPYVHSRPPVSGGSLQLRAIQDDRETSELMAEDAELAISSLLRFLQRFSVPIDEPTS